MYSRSVFQHCIGQPHHCWSTASTRQQLAQVSIALRPNSWTKSRQNSYEFSSLLLIVTSTALPWDFYFFKLTQPLTVSVREQGGKLDRNPYPLLYGFRNPYKNLKSENSQDYAQKTQWNCTFMNSASAARSCEQSSASPAQKLGRKS